MYRNKMLDISVFDKYFIPEPYLVNRISCDVRFKYLEAKYWTHWTYRPPFTNQFFLFKSICVRFLHYSYSKYQRPMVDNLFSSPLLLLLAFVIWFGFSLLHDWKHCLCVVTVVCEGIHLALPPHIFPSK